MYIFQHTVDCLETRQNYRACPQELHSHKVLFDIYLSPESVENEEDYLEQLRDSISDRVYLDSKWTVKRLVEEMMKDLINSEFKVTKVRAKVEELQISYEVEKLS